MDAIEFLREWQRMCKVNTIGEPFGTCCNGNCQLLKIRDNVTDSCMSTVLNKIYESVPIVEKWSKNHPQKTRLQDLLEKFPNAIVSADGKVAKACALELGYCDSCNYIGDGCRDCWNEPAE